MPDQKQIKLIYEDRCENRTYPWGDGEMIKGGFYNEGKILFSFLTPSNDYEFIHFVKFQEAIHLCSFTLK